MANKRRPGQKLIPFPASEKFIHELNQGFRRTGYSNRSQFIRDAIIEKLNRMGIETAPQLAAAPDRIGKGGRLSTPAPRPAGKKPAGRPAAKRVPARRSK